ncbi:actin filament-associated protein 1-like 2 isoform X2 [Engraulis encrasicolus]|uniref:actin filament-associated protein 1-like 2 isoform X2 n=1 Tax=Engraulis encrasicolus TaxID=184585 RepID=UPI002FD5909D
MDKHKVLERLLEELQRFLKLLDAEKLSGNATVHKSLLTDLLHSYTSNGGDEEYIYMNKVVVGNSQTPTDREHRSEPESNGKYTPGPHKSLPELPPPRSCVMSREPFPLPCVPTESPEGYYEEAQPYDTTINDDGEAVSSSYESYDEDEVSKVKSAAQHQWPSTEASIELMKDARICAFLWRKKWLGQWAKQLCVIRDTRLLCYKSSKDQTPLLDVSLVGCSVIYKEKQPKRREHKLKIVPLGGEAIVLGLQSKEQTEQWLKVIQEISPKSTEGADVSDSPRLICTKAELGERHSVASESGSSTDSHVEPLEAKDVKKKYGGGLKFSNLMNIGKKKIPNFDSPEKCVDTSGYLNVLVNNQWRARWCLIKNGQLWFYQDKSKGKVARQPVPLEGCLVLPDPSPEHLYSFRIQMDGEQLAQLEAKSSAEMGHWLGLLLSQTGTKTDPEELAYDYVNSERISSIVNAAKTSMYLMQRRYSEPNTYTDSPPSDVPGSDDIYDDVASTENEMEDGQENGGGDVLTVEQDSKDQLYLDLVPVRSFLHTSTNPTSPQPSALAPGQGQGQGQNQAAPQPPPRDPSPQPQAAAEQTQDDAYQDVLPNEQRYETRLPSSTPPPPQRPPDPEPPSYTSPRLQPQPQPQVQAQPQTQTQSQNQNQSPAHPKAQPSSFLSQEVAKKTGGSVTSQEAAKKTSISVTSQEAAKKTSTSVTSQEVAKKTSSVNSNSTTCSSSSSSCNSSSSSSSTCTSTTSSTSFLSTATIHTYPAAQTPQSPQPPRGRAASADKARVLASVCSGSVEGKLGKNRTEADVRRYTDERDRLEKDREQVKSSLATYRKERRDAKEELSTCQDPAKQAVLEACLKLKDEACREAERRRVEVELRLVEVKESLRKVEAGPFTLGTTVDSSLMENIVSKVSSSTPPVPAAASIAPVSNGEASPVNSATALKNRPLSIMQSKGNVLAKAKEWEKKRPS